MSYSLPVPRLSANATVGQNLQGNDQITPGELRSYSNFSLAYSNLCNTLFMNAGLGLQERQMRDVTDPNQFTQGSLTYYLSGSYIPVHQRWWTRASAYFIQQAEDDPLGIQSDRDFDTRNETVLDYTVGKKIGTKYLVELRTRLRSRANENQDSYVSVQRDFHDVVAGVSLGIRSKDRLSDVSETAEDNFQVRFNLKFKPSSQKGVVPLTNSRTLFNGQRTSAFDRNG